MTTEISGGRHKDTDFTFEGKPLFIRRLPLRLGLKLQSVSEGETVPAEIIAEIISECIVFEGGGKVWTHEDVLDFDTQPMLEIFSAISESSISGKDAEKN